MLDVLNDGILTKEQAVDAQQQFTLLGDLQLALVGGGGGAASLD